MSLNDLPSYKELEVALKKLRNGEAACEDGLPAEHFKCGGISSRNAVLILLHMVWDEEAHPRKFKDATIIPFFKGKRSRQKSDNYRGISLLSAAGKILSPMLLN